MAEEPFALTTPAPPATEADYDTICAAVMETGRGRWFLAEYARRNRNADTQILLAALERIEAATRGEPAAPPASTRLADAKTDAIKTDAIKTDAIKTEAMKPDAGDTGKGGPPQDLANALENATAAIRAATEHLQDVAWRLRELQYDDRFCDKIDSGTRDIAAACMALEGAAAAARRMMTPIAEPANGVGAAPEATALDTPSETVAALARPRNVTPASESAASKEAFESAWGLGATPEGRKNPPEPEPIAAAQALSENVWDQSACVRAFETEAAPTVSLWQLPEDTSGTQPAEPPAEAGRDAATAEPAASIAALVAEAVPVEGGAEAAVAVEPPAAGPETGSRSDGVAPQPATDPAEDRTQKKFRHAPGQATLPEQLPRGGWLSNLLLTRVAQGKTDDDTGESEARRDNEIAAAPNAMLPAATAPARAGPMQAEPITAIAEIPPVVLSEPPPEASAPVSLADGFSAFPEGEPASPRNALAVPESVVVEMQQQAVAEMPAPGDAGTADIVREPAHAPEAVEVDATEAAAADAEDDPAGFLLEPLPAALTAGIARPQDIANTAPDPQSAPHDPLAPIRALSEEEKIALFS